jgi:hypothetical protein
MSLPYDIIYNIYFHISDYETLMHFYILNKEFYNNYIRRYNKSYKHKFKILFRDIFGFLSMLPYLKNNNADLHIFDCISTISIEPTYKKTISNDIFFIYYMYKGIIFEESFHKLGMNIAPDLTNVILIQGPNHLDLNTKVIFNKNRIKIVLSETSRLLEINNI